MMNDVLRAIKDHRLPLAILFLVWGVFFASIFFRAISLTDYEGLMVYHPHLWSDWALHLSIVNTFAHKPPSEWFLYHPMFAEGAFNYPFLANLISAGFVRAGFSLPLAMAIPSTATAFALLLGLYFLAFRLIKSRWAALLSVFLFFLSSGPGLWRALFYRLVKGEAWPENITTLLDTPWLDGNVIVATLFPQRGFLMGMALASCALALILSAIRPEANTRHHRYYLAVGGILLGLLPIAHMHSLIACLPFLIFASVYFRKQWKLLLWAQVPMAILSLITYRTFISGTIQNPDFFRWNPGWDDHLNAFSWVVFWWDIWGVSIPIFIAGLIYLIRGKKNALLFGFGASFILIWSLANLILFQPIAWDNSKLFFWSYWGICCVSAAFLLSLRWRMVAVLLTVLMAGTGVFEVVRLQKRMFTEAYQLSSRDEIDFGLQLRAQTKTDDRFATAFVHNHLVTIWALRPIMLGYEAWAMNFGFRSSERAGEMRRVFNTPWDAEDFIKEHKISYLFLGPHERREYTELNEQYFRCQYPIAFSDATNLVFDLRHPRKTPCPH